jgi:tRNA(fMet)-specific endonuclease VapC
MYVLDTNTLIHFFRGSGGVAARMLAEPPEKIALPSVVVYELETGVARSVDATRRRKQLDSLLSVVRVLDFGRDEARTAAGVRARLEQAGTPIGPMDTLIAGTALAHRGVLVTHNVREFSRVPDLVVEDWYTG